MPGAPPESGPASGQFIVVYHPGPGNIDLNDWRIGHLATSAGSTITNSLIVPPGGRVVFGELALADWENEYGTFPTFFGLSQYHQIDLPDYQIKDGITFTQSVAKAACNSGELYFSPVPSGELAVWDSVSASWLSGGLISATCDTSVPPMLNTIAASSPQCPPTGPCAITDIQVSAICANDNSGLYDVTVLVSYTNAPLDGLMTINGFSGPVFQNPQPFTFSSPPTNSLVVSAAFPSGPCSLTVTDPVDISSSCICNITQMDVVGFGACDSNGLVDVTLDIYADNPPSPFLSVFSLNNLIRLDVTYTGTPTRVTVQALGSGSSFPIGARLYPSNGSTCQIVTNIAMPFCANACRTSVDFLGFGPCSNGTTTVELDVQVVNAFDTQIIAQLDDAAIVVPITGATTRVSLPVVADGRPLDLIIGPSFCEAFTNFNINIPTCPNVCAISNVSVVAIGACEIDDMVEVVTKVEFSASLMPQLRVGQVTRPVTSSPMLFTNRYLADGSTIDISVEWDFPNAMNIGIDPDLISRCPGQILRVDLPLCTCFISDVVISDPIGPCRTDGLVPVEVTVFYENIEPNFELVLLAGDGPQVFPLTGSPQIEQVLINRSGFNSSMLATIRELVPVQQQVPFGPTNTFREVCSRRGFNATLPNCPRLPCEILSVNIRSLNCAPGGIAELVIEVVHTNTSVGALVGFSGFPGIVGTPNLRPSPHIETMYFPANGQVISANVSILNGFLSAECSTNLSDFATLPVCTDPCHLTSFAPVGISACANGMVDVTFEIAASNALGSWFGVELQDRTVSDFFIYTNTPMQAVLTLPGDGSLIDVVAGQAVPNMLFTYDYNTNCALLADDILRLPNCSVIPSVCLTNPPAFLDMVNVPTPTFSFHMPFGVTYELESTTDLTMPWTPMMTTGQGTNGVELMSLPLQPAGLRFYRLRCRN